MALELHLRLKSFSMGKLEILLKKLEAKNILEKQELKKRNRKRYRLHRLIRSEGFKLITRERTIYVYFDNINFTENVLKLRNEFEYSIQTEIK